MFRRAAAIGVQLEKKSIFTQLYSKIRASKWGALANFKKIKDACICMHMHAYARFYACICMHMHQTTL